MDVIEYHTEEGEVVQLTMNVELPDVLNDEDKKLIRTHLKAMIADLRLTTWYKFTQSDAIGSLCDRISRRSLNVLEECAAEEGVMLRLLDDNNFADAEIMLSERF